MVQAMGNLKSNWYRRTKKTIGILLVGGLLLGCNAIQDLKGMFEKQSLVKNAIKDQYGWDCQVSWNIHNASLTRVLVVFEANEVRDEKVATLETAVLDAVEDAFSSKPKAIYVQIVSKEPLKYRDRKSAEMNLSLHQQN